MATEKKKKKIIKKPIGGPVKPKLPPKLPVDGRTPPPATIQPVPTIPSVPPKRRPLPDIDPDTGLKKPISSSFRWFAELAKAIFLRRTRTA